MTSGNGLLNLKWVMFTFPYGVPKQMIFSFFTTIQASHYHTLTWVRASDKGLLVTLDSWFVKIVYTFFLCWNPLDDRFLCYFHKHLTPSLVLEVVKRLNNPSLGFKFFQFTRERLNVPHSFWTYNMLLRSLCEAGLYNSAKLLYDCMRCDGKLPDSRLLGFLVCSFALAIGLMFHRNYWLKLTGIRFKIDKVDRACDLLKEVCLISEIAPNVVSYTTVISGYCRLGKLKEASSLLDEMVRSGTRPNAFTFSALVDGFVKAGDMASALGMHKKMLLYGSSLNAVTLTSLIDGYCRVGLVNHGLDLWHEMNARNICASLYTFFVLISALCKSNRLQEARDLLRLLKRSDILPQSFVYNPRWILKIWEH
ncbi:pentatricopeptide repeat-containing protein At2g06000-like [Abrus precatorius]|uniref:Pentatricopeptide repeat-containing protein At2g06000-like n=1 Tax=Abrus precatorius TaxID=3816 RepID=A0A8B8LM12_ABRPR|nr:pentatricopeptide repeat-containing protein At2g06000-like [Abrus precatorius]